MVLLVLVRVVVEYRSVWERLTIIVDQTSLALALDTFTSKTTELSYIPSYKCTYRVRTTPNMNVSIIDTRYTQT